VRRRRIRPESAAAASTEQLAAALRANAGSVQNKQNQSDLLPIFAFHLEPKDGSVQIILHHHITIHHLGAVLLAYGDLKINFLGTSHKIDHLVIHWRC
jgi:hypothetical protein